MKGSERMAKPEESKAVSRYEFCKDCDTRADQHTTTCWLNQVNGLCARIHNVQVDLDGHKETVELQARAIAETKQAWTVENKKVIRLDNLLKAFTLKVELQRKELALCDEDTVTVARECVEARVALAEIFRAFVQVCGTSTGHFTDSQVEAVKKVKAVLGI